MKAYILPLLNVFYCVFFCVQILILTYCYKFRLQKNNKKFRFLQILKNLLKKANKYLLLGHLLCILTSAKEILNSRPYVCLFVC